MTCAAWRSGDSYDDTFAIEQHGTRLNVTRTDGGGIGWGMTLIIVCCEPSRDAKAEATPATPALAAGHEAALRGPNHYRALQVRVISGSCRAVAIQWRDVLV